MQFIFFIYLILSIVFEISAQYLFKLIHLNKIKTYKQIVLLLGVMFYAFTGYFAYKLLNHAELGVVNIIWHLFHFIMLFVIGYLFLNEKLNNRKLIATLIGGVSLLLFITDGEGHNHS